MADTQSDDRKTVIDNIHGILPKELMREILSCSPVQSLLKFRFVSKSWNRLFTLDPSFSKNLSILAIAPHISIRLVADYTACDQAIILNSPFDQGIGNIWGICNGLLCVSLEQNDEEIFIWNPLIRDYITLPNCPPTPRFSNDGKYVTFYDWGFCYQRDSDEYIVIRVFVEFDLGKRDYHSQVSLCTLGKDSIWSWRSIEKDFLFAVGCATPCPVVNGAFHWLASRPQEEVFDFIVAFDIKDEAFREMRPPQNAIFKSLVIAHGVTNLNGKLCMYSLCPHENVQIWIMTQYEVIDSWTKQFEIGVAQILGSFGYLVPLGVTHTGEIILEKDNELVLYNRENNSVVNLGGFEICDRICVYTASILSPKFLLNAMHIQT